MKCIYGLWLQLSLLRTTKAFLLFHRTMFLFWFHSLADSVQPLQPPLLPLTLLPTEVFSHTKDLNQLEFSPVFSNLLPTYQSFQHPAYLYTNCASTRILHTYKLAIVLYIFIYKQLVRIGGISTLIMTKHIRLVTAWPNAFHMTIFVCFQVSAKKSPFPWMEKIQTTMIWGGTTPCCFQVCGDRKLFLLLTGTLLAIAQKPTSSSICTTRKKGGKGRCAGKKERP